MKRFNPQFRALPIALLTAAVLGGCQSHSAGPTTRDYQTVSQDPHRDNDAAHRDNEAALQLINKGDYTAAEPILRRALSEDVMYGPAHNNLGLVYFHQSKLYLAAWEFQYASKLMPNQPEARNNLGLVFEAGGKLDQAIDSYESAMKVEPDNAQFVGNLARARVRRGDKESEVRPLLERLVEIDQRPDWVEWARERLSRAPAASTTDSRVQ